MHNIDDKSFLARFVCAPEAYLAGLESFPETTLKMGKWVNDWVTRCHYLRKFELSEAPTAAFAEFQGDNPFCVYVNGFEIKPHKTDSAWHVTGAVDIAKYLVKGQNHLAVRYHTADNSMIAVAALRGNVQIGFADGSELCVPTDSSWKNGMICDFWAETEPKGWETAPIPDGFHNINEYEIHPRLRRRSCILKKDVCLKDEVASARLFGAALGTYVPYINGTRVTDGRFLAGSMKTCTEYREFDVTSLLKKGENTVSALTGMAQYGCVSWGTLRCDPPAVMLQLEVTYADGKNEIIGTDESWRISASALYDNDLQYGERYDARLEGTFNWTAAVLADVRDIPPFKKADYPEVRAVNECTAVSIGDTLGGEYKLYDFGTNSAGRAKITLKNTKAGEVIILRYCEQLENGNPKTDVYGDVFFGCDNAGGGISPYGLRNLDVYICKGAECEVYAPEFAYTGFKYVYIKGYSGEYTAETVKKLEFYNDLEVTGDFTSQSADLNRIWDAVKRSYRSNIVTGPTDCPTREKNFWNGDIAYFGSVACWYMQNNAFLSQWTKYGTKIQYDVYGWEDEEYILPLVLYRYYGNRKVLEAKYPIITALIEKREKVLQPDGLPTGPSPYNDHQATENVPSDFFSAVYFCRMYRDCAKIAEILGKKDDAAALNEKYIAAKRAFNSKYYLSDSAEYAPKNQSSIILPIAFGVAENENIPQLTKTLNGYVEKSGYTLTCGFSSVEFALGILCDCGYFDTAWRVINGTEFPSMLYMLNNYKGGTTTESWSMSTVGDSMNHYAIGGITRWFFEYLGGLSIVKPDFYEICIKPVFYKQLGGCMVNYNSRHGEIVTEWNYDKAAAAFVWRITVPQGVKANLQLFDGFAFADNCESPTAVTNGCFEFKVKAV